jgi:hypothetical protein
VHAFLGRCFQVGHTGRRSISRVEMNRSDNKFSSPTRQTTCTRDPQLGHPRSLYQSRRSGFNLTLQRSLAALWPEYLFHWLSESREGYECAICFCREFSRVRQKPDLREDLPAWRVP